MVEIASSVNFPAYQTLMVEIASTVNLYASQALLNGRNISSCGLSCSASTYGRSGFNRELSGLANTFHQAIVTNYSAFERVCSSYCPIALDAASINTVFSRNSVANPTPNILALQTCVKLIRVITNLDWRQTYA